jgi:uncharacterized protein RhaS with RHS repeats
MNRLTRLENDAPSGVISSYDYTLGLSGNRMKIVEHDGTESDYEYDLLYRLKREERNGRIRRLREPEVDGCWQSCDIL